MIFSTQKSSAQKTAKCVPLISIDRSFPVPNISSVEQEYSLRANKNPSTRVVRRGYIDKSGPAQLFAGKAFDEETRVGLQEGAEEGREDVEEKLRRRRRGRNKTALVESAGGRFMVVAYRMQFLMRDTLHHYDEDRETSVFSQLLRNIFLAKFISPSKRKGSNSLYNLISFTELKSLHRSNVEMSTEKNDGQEPSVQTYRYKYVRSSFDRDITVYEIP